ncbi:MAG: hypothetical protein KDD64_04590 [Bdellovibrionales bacterium]|nr:hypothetical protein [Bdellovibrionales bacterium]
MGLISHGYEFFVSFVLAALLPFQASGEVPPHPKDAFLAVYEGCVAAEISQYVAKHSSPARVSTLSPEQEALQLQERAGQLARHTCKKGFDACHQYDKSVLCREFLEKYRVTKGTSE